MVLYLLPRKKRLAWSLPTYLWTDVILLLSSKSYPIHNKQLNIFTKAMLSTDYTVHS